MSKYLRTRYQAVHRHFSTTAMILSIAAIVLALGGGAYAAIHYDKKASKGLSQAQVIALIKKYAKAGPEGKQGAQGNPGTNGTDGTNGTAGEKGKGIVLLATAHTCHEGGVTIEVEGSPATKQEICNGEEGTPGNAGANGNSVLNGVGAPTTQGVPGDFYIDTQSDNIYGPKVGSSWGTGTALKGEKGSPWPGGGTLAPLATETGAWSNPLGEGSNERESTFEFIPVSFPIPLTKPIAEGHALFVNDEEQTNASGTSYEHCLGSVEQPKAVPGYFCAYQGETHIGFQHTPEEFRVASISAPGESPYSHFLESGNGTTGTSGTIMGLLYAFAGKEYEHEMFGSFAATAPCPTGEEAVEEPSGSGEFVCKPEP